MQQITLVLSMLLSSSAGAASGDWPMYGADAARSSYTASSLPDKLSRRWSHVARHPPMPAWPTRNRLCFDAAYQPVVANGKLFYGSSADGKVYALDAVSGEPLWTFFTDAPIRFAPAVWQDRLFVTSDDGHLYCLGAEDGQPIWKLRGGPRGDMLLGNDRMISRWPARGGPVVLDDTVYFAAGIWPSEGVYIYAVNANTGRVMWCNDSTGSLEMDQPHKTARARSGVAAQGHLVATADTLLVPTGRAVPAAFARFDGALRFFQLQLNQQRGGAEVVAAAPYFFNGGAVYSLSDGVPLGDLGLPLAVHPRSVVAMADGRVKVWDRQHLFVEKERTDRRGKKTKVKVLGQPTWTVVVPFDKEPIASKREETRTPDNVMNSTAWTRTGMPRVAGALVVADNKIIVGGQGQVTIVDMNSRSLAWTANVRGSVRGLAVANECLYVSTDRGDIECFAGATTPIAPPSTTRSPGLTPADRSKYVLAAEEILRQTDVREGYCLDVACGDGRLAIELARRSKLQIYAIDADPENVRSARHMIDEAGLYGVRITVHCGDPASLSYPNHCADLVVSGRSVVDGPASVVSPSTINRMLRPQYGRVCVGKPGAMSVAVRGPLAGAGAWTHQNADLANTLCSDDAIVRSPLEMLWFRDTDLVMPNRHGRGPGPLVHEGIMFVEGLHCLRAQSIYNGRTLWEVPLPGVLASYHREHSIGAAWTGGNYCVAGDRLYVHDGQQCLCLDVRSGRQVAKIQPPRCPDGTQGVWGYIACDGKLLFGSLVDQNYLVKSWSDRWDTGGQFTESLMLFALNARTGEVEWTFEPQQSIRHNAIAIGHGRVYLVDREPAPFDDVRRSESDVRAQARRRAQASGSGEDEVYQRLISHRPGQLLALDVQTGQPLWRADKETFATLLVYSSKHDVLLAAYQAVHQATRDSERGDRLAAFRASDGKALWNAAATYDDRPVLRDSAIYAPPGAWDLLTGAPLPFTFERSYGCGIVVGSRRLLVFRSATLGYLDLERSNGTENYGGVRPGCWIAGIPAGGLLLMQDAASWCTCSYLNQATMALQPRDERRPLPAGGRSGMKSGDFSIGEDR